MKIAKYDIIVKMTRDSGMFKCTMFFVCCIVCNQKINDENSIKKKIIIMKIARDRGMFKCTMFFVRLPAPTVPNFSLMPDVLSDAFALSIVVFAISVSMGKILARRHGYEIDSNQVKYM